MSSQVFTLLCHFCAATNAVSGTATFVLVSSVGDQKPTKRQHTAKGQKKERRIQKEEGTESEGEKGESSTKGKEQEGAGGSSAEEG